VQDELERLNPARVFVLGGTSAVSTQVEQNNQSPPPPAAGTSERAQKALAALESLTVTTKEASGYDRKKFGSGWSTVYKCDTRNRVLLRDLKVASFDEGKCHVLSGTLEDPYTGTTIDFVRGVGTSNAVQIDHVVAVSTAWKMGANTWTDSVRRAFYNDEENLLAVDGPTNGSKGDKTLGEWQPPNESFHCEFTLIYVEVTDKYDLALKPVDKEFAQETLPSC